MIHDLCEVSVNLEGNPKRPLHFIMSAKTYLEYKKKGAHIELVHRLVYGEDYEVIENSDSLTPSPRRTILVDKYEVVYSQKFIKQTKIFTEREKREYAKSF